ncbi:MAG: hypothetical protein RDU14_15925 [Melioribacteraceae bacterium]|nr:hypothetical protein [Melioribacteraceae bacterium]
MKTSERMEVSFHVKEYGEPSNKPIIEIEPKGKWLSILSGDSDTLYLYLKDEYSMEKAYDIAKYLRENISALGFVPTN